MRSQPDVAAATLYASLVGEFKRLGPQCADYRVPVPVPQDPDRAYANWTLEIPQGWPEECRELLRTLLLDHQARFDVQDDVAT